MLRQEVLVLRSSRSWWFDITLDAIRLRWPDCRVSVLTNGSGVETVQKNLRIQSFYVYPSTSFTSSSPCPCDIRKFDRVVIPIARWDYSAYGNIFSFARKCFVNKKKPVFLFIPPASFLRLNIRGPFPYAAFFHGVLWRLFFPWAHWMYHVDPLVTAPRIRGFVNRFLAERGITAPWIMPPDKLLERWALQSRGSSNYPGCYVEKSNDAMEVLNELFQNYISHDEEIFEIGCNCGVNLDWLRKAGYRNLSGNDINPEVIPVMKRAYPELSANILIGPLEVVLGSLPDHSFDLVFSKAVLYTLHPASHRVFSEIDRISRRWICVMEPEHLTAAHLVPRRYDRIFSLYGFRCVEEKKIYGIKRYEGFVLRLLKRTSWESNL